MFNAPPSINRTLYQSKGQKLAVFGGLFFLFVIGLVCALVALSMISGLARGSSDSSVKALLWSTGVSAVCAFGIFKLMPAFRRPVDYAPRFGVPPAAWGHPFDARLQRKGMGPGFSGEGVVQFFPDHMIVDGHRETSGYVQLAILLAVTIVPIVTIGGGLGLIPAAVLAKYIGRKKIVQPIPYHAIRSLSLEGNRAVIDCPGLSPSKIAFYVASVDGPRLQGEIQPRFPAAVPGLTAQRPL
jgi:hypothetical protein